MGSNISSSNRWPPYTPPGPNWQNYFYTLEFCLTYNYFRILCSSENLGSGLQTNTYDRDICFSHLDRRHNIIELQGSLYQNLRVFSLINNYFRTFENLGSGLQTMTYGRNICFSHLNQRRNIKELQGPHIEI